MTNIEYSNALKFSKYFPNNLEYASKVYTFIQPERKSRRRRKRKSPYDVVDQVEKDNNETQIEETMVTQTRTNCTERAVQTEMMDTHMFVQTDHITTLSTGVQTDKITIDVTPLHATEIKAKEKFDIKTENVDETISKEQLKNVQSAPSPSTSPDSKEDHRQIEKSNSEQKLSKEVPNREPQAPPDNGQPLGLNKIHESNNRIGQPKIIISFPRFSNENYFNPKKVDVLLEKALADVIERIKCCGILFDGRDRTFFERIFGENGNPTNIYDNQFYHCINRKKQADDNKKITTQTTGSITLATERESEVTKLLNLERHINKEEKFKFCKDSEKESRVPVVLLIVGGDLSVLEHAAEAVHCDISVVVVKGTGGTADVIDSCLNGDPLSSTQDVNLRKSLPIVYLQRFDQDAYERIKKDIYRIRQREWMVSSFDFKLETSESLWEKITDGIIRSWSYEQKTENASDQSQNMSISKYAVQIEGLSKKQIFEEKNTSESHEEKFIKAMVMNNIGIVLEIWRTDNVMLSVDQCTKLLRMLKSEHDKPEKENSYNLLKSIYPAELIESLKSVTVITEYLLKGEFLTKCGKRLFCCCRHHDSSTEKKEIKIGPNEALRIGVLLNDHAKFQIWQECDFPLMTALVASVYLFSMAEKAKECFQESLQKSLEKHATGFRNRAILLLEKLYDFDKGMAKEAMDYVCDIWDLSESPIHFSHQYNIEEFISHSHVQKEADKRMYAYNIETIVNEQNVLEKTGYIQNKSTGDFRSPDKNTGDIGSQDLNTADVKHQDKSNGDIRSQDKNTADVKNQDKSTGDIRRPEKNAGSTLAFSTHSFINLINLHWKEKTMKKFISAPIVRFSIHVVCFLVAMFIFSVFLTTQLTATSVSLLEVIVLVFMCGELFEEILSMIRPNEKFSGRRIVFHFYDIWNSLDALCIILYITAFLLHSSPISDNLVHIRRLYSLSLFFMYLRVFNFLLLLRKLGIIIIMVKEMLTDLLYYLVILFFLLWGGGVVYHANLYPNHSVSAFPSGIHYWRIWTVLKIPFWQVFGDPMLDTLEASDLSDCTNNETIWRNNPDVERCPSYEWITPVIAALYMMLTNWLLLNIVIAMFSSRFGSIEAMATQKWRYHRHSVVIDYEQKYPSPFNIPIRVYYCLVNCTFDSNRTRCRCCCKDDTTPKDKPKKMLEKQKEFAKQILEEEKTQEN